MSSKRKMKGILIGPIVFILIIGLFVAREICFRVLIIPHWLSQPKAQVEKAFVRGVEVQGRKEIDQLYDLIQKTKIRTLTFDTGETSKDVSDDKITINFTYKDGAEDYVEYNLAGDLLEKEEDYNDLYWVYGEGSEKLHQVLKNIADSKVIPGKFMTYKQVVDLELTEVKKELKENKKVIEKIIRIAERDGDIKGKDGMGNFSKKTDTLHFINESIRKEMEALMEHSHFWSFYFDPEEIDFHFKASTGNLVSMIYTYEDKYEQEDSFSIASRKIKPHFYLKSVRLDDTE